MVLQTISSETRSWTRCHGKIMPAQKTSQPVAQENTSSKSRPSYTFALIRVCRQLYLETHLLPFHLNTFIAPSARALDMWFSQHPTQMAALRVFRVDSHDILDSKRRDCTFEAINQLVGLHVLEVKMKDWVWYDDFTPMDMKAKYASSRQARVAMYVEQYTHRAVTLEMLW
ncbi:hypothetical protein BKA63DRAFT_510813 [Paraphoma chrysanthemicola]|nr:hypothetical protein BKA63DRAFT_510813 [Paraphoma chrysanthemicola]